MLLFDGPLTFREFMTHEELPLAAVFREVLLYLRERSDAVLFGAHAVNAYCEPARMTEDIDVLSTDAASLAEDLRQHLGSRFGIAARVREIVPGGYRVYQKRKPKNRHLADIRQTDVLPAFQVIEGVRVVAPSDLVALKAIAVAARHGREKGLSDRLDLARMLRTFPHLRTDADISERVHHFGGGPSAVDAWRDAAAHPLEPDDVDDGDDD